MRLSEAELEEGRRLLEESRKQQAMDVMGIAATVWNRWVADHADALLASREEIARDAVREFAEAVLDIWPDEKVMRDGSEFMRGSVGTVGVTRDMVRALAAARGATLDEKP